MTDKAKEISDEQPENFAMVESGPSIKKFISDFMCNWSRQRLNVKGKLTITIDDASEVDIKFQPKHTTVSQECEKPKTVQHLDSLPQTHEHQYQGTGKSVHYNANEKEPHKDSHRSHNFLQGGDQDHLQFYSENHASSSINHFPNVLSTSQKSFTSLKHDSSSSYLNQLTNRNKTGIGMTNVEIAKYTNWPDRAYSASTSTLGTTFSNSNPDQYSNSHSSSASLPPFEKIMQTRHSSHSSMSHFSNLTDAIDNNSVVLDTNHDNISDYTHSLLHGSSTDVNILPRTSFAVPSSPLFKEGDGLHVKEPDRKAADMQENENMPHFASDQEFTESNQPYQELSLGLVGSESAKDSEHAMPFNNNESQAKEPPNPREAKSQQNIQESSTLTVPKHDCMQLDKVNLNDLKNLSHSELVDLLTQVLHNQDRMKTDESHCSAGTSAEMSSSKTNDGDKDNSNNKTEHGISVAETSRLSSEESQLPHTSDDVTCLQIKNVEVHLEKEKQILSKNTEILTAVNEDKKSTNKRRSPRAKIKGGINKGQDALSLCKETPFSSDSLTPLKKRKLRSAVTSDKTEDVKSEQENNGDEKGEEPKNKNKDITENKKGIDLMNASDSSTALKQDKDKEGRTRMVQKTQFECKDCLKTFSNKSVYKRHVRSHTSGYQCDICGKTLKTKDTLYHHQRGLHSKEKPYKCEQCNISFNFNHSYKLHMQRHKGVRPYECEICHKTYLTANHLKVHTDASHGIGNIVCHICGKTFSYNCSLKIHLLSHSGERPYNCELCDKSFTTKQNLKSHRSSHAEGRQFQCDICGKFYKSEHSRNVHSRWHKKEGQNHMCDICGKTFLFRNSLQSHTFVHKKVRPFNCQICGKAFKTQAAVATHKYIHRETLAYECSVCGKQFKTKSCKTAHEKRHNKADAQTCSTCGSNFPDKSGLAKHVKTVHTPQKQFICNLCGKASTRADNMRTHVLGHKNDVTSKSTVMDFITVKHFTDTDDLRAQPQVTRPRLRGLKQKAEKKVKSQENEGVMSSERAPTSVQSSNFNGQESNNNNNNNNCSLVTSLQLPTYSVPTLNNFSASSGKEQESFDGLIPPLASSHNSYHQPPPTMHSLTHMRNYSQAPSHHFQPDLGGTNLSSGPLSTLLLSVTPKSETDSADVNHLSSASFHPDMLPSMHGSHSHGQVSQRVVFATYMDSLVPQGSMNSFQQMMLPDIQNNESTNHVDSLNSISNL